jgi:hypothetical protein
VRVRLHAQHLLLARVLWAWKRLGIIRKLLAIA